MMKDEAVGGRAKQLFQRHWVGCAYRVCLRCVCVDFVFDSPFFFFIVCSEVEED